MRKVLTKLLAIAFAFSLVLTACGSKEGKLAKVGEEYITDEDLEEVLDLYRAQFGEDIFDLDTEEGQNALLQIKPEAVNQLIYQKMSEKMVEEYDIKVTDEEVEEAKVEIIAQIGGDENYEEMLEAEGATDEEITESLKINLQNQRLQEKIEELNAPTDEEVMEAIKNNKEEKTEFDADHILISKQPDQPEPSEEGEEPEPPTEEEIEEIRENALNKAEQLYKEITEDGRDFAEVAKEESEDPGSAEEGGALGKFLKEVMVPEFGEALEEMKVGEISEPVESDFGFHIIRLNSVARDFDEMDEETQELIKEEQRSLLLNENIEEFFKEKEEEYGVERY